MNNKPVRAYMEISRLLCLWSHTASRILLFTWMEMLFLSVAQRFLLFWLSVDTEQLKNGIHEFCQNIVCPWRLTVRKTSFQAYRHEIRWIRHVSSSSGRFIQSTFTSRSPITWKTQVPGHVFAVGALIERDWWGSTATIFSTGHIVELFPYYLAQDKIQQTGTTHRDVSQLFHRNNWRRHH